MSSEERPRSSERTQRRPRRPETPKNNPRLGALLVGAAAFVGLLLFIAGGGGSSASDDDSNGNSGGSDDGGGTVVASSTTAAPNTVAPADLEIIVANGAGVSGLAGDTADILAAAGFTRVAAVDGTSTATTQVYFVAGSEVDAAGIIDVLKLSVDRLVPMPDPPPLSNAELGTARVLVLLGPDFKPDIVRAANATTTTAPG